MNKIKDGNMKETSEQLGWQDWPKKRQSEGKNELKISEMGPDQS